MIYILTDDIRSGKTTALLHWSKNRTDVDGVLCPDDNSGKRYFLKIKSQETMPLEVEDKDDLKLVFVGKFRFLKSSFDKANQYLTNASEKHPNYLVIDELGKLELNNEGLHGAAAILINNYGADKNKHLILVVRRSLVEPILAHYKIQDHRLISKDDLREDCFA